VLLASVGDSAVLVTPPSRNSTLLVTPLSCLSSKVGKIRGACDTTEVKQRHSAGALYFQYCSGSGAGSGAGSGSLLRTAIFAFKLG